MINGFALMGSFAIFGLLISAWEACMVIGLWRLFEKAGEDGWRAIIPGYNLYVQYALTWDVNMFWKGLALWGASVVCNWIGGVFHLVGIIAATGMMAIFAVGNMKLAEAYGKGMEHTLALIFFYPVGILLLAFGDAQYKYGKEY